MPRGPTIAMMTGGGDAPGLNAVIRAVVKRGVSQLRWRILGIEDSFDGLLESPRRVVELHRNSVRGILTRGGTILGTTNHGNPFAWTSGPEPAADRSAEVVAALAELGAQGLIAVGGDGTMAICAELARRFGLRVVGVPKTIDNDICGTELTFGFDTAMAFATEAVDRLHATAEAHERVMVVEVMGRHAGHLALGAGVGGGADVILIPEIPFRYEPVVAKIQRRREFRRHFSIVVVAEGAAPAGGTLQHRAHPGARTESLGGIGARVAEEIAQRTGLEVRCTVLGHLQRGGTPTPFDRVLASRMGNAAVELVEAGRYGRMVAIVDGRMSDVPIEAVVEGKCRGVDVLGDLVRTARGMGIVLGDEADRPPPG
jgi:phosphofructokinase-like protein